MEKSKSIRKKISQLIVPRLEGNLLTEPFYFEKIKTLVESGIGGFILFGGKYLEVKESLKELQEISGIPLYIASDLEQGLGQQVEGGTLFPNAMAIASAINPDNIDDIKLLREAIKVIALEAMDVGINVILAPVLDVNTNPKNPIICTRAFSDDPENVAWFGKEFIDGIQSHGLIACVKHFPGHGDTEMDSHIELPVIKASTERLNTVELYPFIEAIKAGVRMIMVGHIRVEALDPERPASLSYKVIHDLLRYDLCFNGIVITDAMNMGAIKNSYNENEACLIALKAGADIILLPEEPESVIEGLLSEEDIGSRVEESLNRILKAKEGLKYEKVDINLSASGKSHMQVTQKLSEKAIKILTGEPKILKNSIVLILDDDSTGAGEDFIETIKMKYPAIESIHVDSENVSSERTKAFDKIKGNPLIVGIFSKISAWKGRNGISPELYQFLKDALTLSVSSTIISFGCPHILNLFQDLAGTLISAYWDSDLAQRSVGKLLCEKSL